jgi:carboxymethylenebutenolidase
MADVAAMLDFLDGQPAVKRGPVGVHGYCMSGPYALAAAARYPDRVAAAASFYGTWIVSEVPNFAMYVMEVMAQRIRGMSAAI